MHAWSLGSDVPGTAPASVGAASRAAGVARGLATPSTKFPQRSEIPPPDTFASIQNSATVGNSTNHAGVAQTNSAVSHRGEFGSTSHRSRAAQQPTFHAAHAAFRVPIEPRRIAGAVLGVTGLDHDHAVRV